MPIQAIVTLDRLECGREKDENGHSEPYIWPVVMRVDDNTLATPAMLSALNAADDHARQVVKQDMKREESAPIPAGQRTFVFNFDDTAKVHTVIVVVALLEQDDTPFRAIKKGYVTFRSELPKAVSTRLFALNSASQEQEAAIIEEIRREVNDAVEATIRDNVSASHKLELLLRLVSADDQIGFAHRVFGDLEKDGKPVNEEFTLRFAKLKGEAVTDFFRLRGRFETRRVVRDRCQTFVDRVKEAQQAVDGIKKEIDRLQDQLKGNTGPGDVPLSKEELIEEIGQVIVEELEPAEDNLDAARRALAQCRASGTRVVASVVDTAVTV